MLILDTTIYCGIEAMRDEWQQRLCAISRAKSFIYVSAYYLDEDSYGDSFCKALCKAALSGVRVYLLLDRFGLMLAQNTNYKKNTKKCKQLLKQVEKSGGQVIIYRPTLIKYLFSAGIHFKLQICSEGSFFLSSGNITSSSYTSWQEITLANSTASSTLGASVLSYFGSYFKSKFLKEDLIHLKSQFAGTEHSPYRLHTAEPNLGFYPKALLPWPFSYKENAISKRLCVAIDNATATIELASFYFKPCPQVFKALYKAAQRGVCIEIIHSSIDALSCSNYPWLPTLAPLNALLYYPKVSVFETNKGQHAKYLLVDYTKKDKALGFIGSYNFEHAAHYRLAELMVESRDPNLLKPLYSYHREQLQTRYATPITRAYLCKLKRGKIGQRLGSYLLRRFV